MRECIGLRWAKKIAASVGGRGTYCVHALRVFGFYCHRYLLPLKRERGLKGGGIKISSGSETGDFEGLLRIEVDQEDSSLCRWRRDVLRYASCVSRPRLPPSQTPSTGGMLLPWALSDGRLGMNRKRPTAIIGGGALFLGRRQRL